MGTYKIGTLGMRYSEWWVPLDRPYATHYPYQDFEDRIRDALWRARKNKAKELREQLRTEKEKII